jgi:hypothetical protein
VLVSIKQFNTADLLPIAPNNDGGSLYPILYIRTYVSQFEEKVSRSMNGRWVRAPRFKASSIIFVLVGRAVDFILHLLTTSYLCPYVHEINQ